MNSKTQLQPYLEMCPFLFVFKNGSLFNVFLATVKENNVENEMSGELPFSRLKMGDRKQGNP